MDNEQPIPADDVRWEQALSLTNGQVSEIILHPAFPEEQPFKDWYPSAEGIEAIKAEMPRITWEDLKAKLGIEDVEAIPDLEAIPLTRREYEMLLAAEEADVFSEGTDYCAFGPVELDEYPMDEEVVSLFIDLDMMDLVMDALIADEYTPLRTNIWRYWRHYAFGDTL